MFCSVGYFTDVSADFESKMPVIGAVAHHGDQCYRLEIVVSNADCVQTSQLLSVYSQLDPRVRPLVIAFRYWARVSTFTFVVLVCFAFITCSSAWFVFLDQTYWLRWWGVASLEIQVRLREGN